ncbi:unnamed protein product [Schistosoma mattheei]|uniref:Uncharacterized protein n=1 Tax=Schistosoma mattheei TaxID=31246 RepID=A0A3P8G096_9TREM|nr:unnamed protein product [Schistosoma mattheei]
MTDAKEYSFESIWTLGVQSNGNRFHNFVQLSFSLKSLRLVWHDLLNCPSLCTSFYFYYFVSIGKHFDNCVHMMNKSLHNSLLLEDVYAVEDMAV